MGLLTPEEQQYYALAHKKHFVAFCDRCKELIPMGQLYVVRKSVPRKDGLTFLGATPTKIRCLACDNKLHPQRKEWREKKSQQKVTGNRIVRRYVTRMFEKNKKLKISTKLLLQKLRGRQKTAKLKHRELTKVLKALKQEKFLLYKLKLWQLRKIKKSKDVQ
jgi:hypothetical protein